MIAGLAKIDKPDFGLSATMSGEAFLPIEGMSHAGAFLFTNHDLNTSSELKKLVELGPSALPFLLENLDNQTPTRLTIDHGGVFGGMWFDNELWGNPNRSRRERNNGSRNLQRRELSWQASRQRVKRL